MYSSCTIHGSTEITESFSTTFMKELTITVSVSKAAIIISAKPLHLQTIKCVRQNTIWTVLHIRISNQSDHYLIII